MIYQEWFTIGEEKYMVSKFPATTGTRIMLRLTKLIGEPLAMLSQGMDTRVDQILPKAVRALIDKLEDEDKAMDLIFDLLKSASINGSTITREVFDLHFQGRMGHLIQLLSAIVGFQFGDFLNGLVVKKPATAVVQSVPRTSSGKSGDSSSQG